MPRGTNKRWPSSFPLSGYIWIRHKRTQLLILIPFSGYVAETLKVQLLLFPSVVSFGIQAHLKAALRCIFEDTIGSYPEIVSTDTTRYKRFGWLLWFFYKRLLEEPRMHACRICRQDSSPVFVFVLGLHVEGNGLSANIMNNIILLNVIL